MKQSDGNRIAQDLFEGISARLLNDPALADSAEICGSFLHGHGDFYANTEEFPTASRVIAAEEIDRLTLLGELSFKDAAVFLGRVGMGLPDGQLPQPLDGAWLDVPGAHTRPAFVA